MSRIGERIKEVRVAKGIGSWKLATRLYPCLRKWRSGSCAVWRIETGKIRPSMRTLPRIAAALGVTLAELLEGVTE